MKRYSATGEHPTGAYVLHSDHEAALKELQDQLSYLKLFEGHADAVSAIKEAVEKEREACAAICNNNNGDPAWKLEQAIRARKDAAHD